MDITKFEEKVVEIIENSNLFKNYKKCSDYFYSAIDYGLPVQWIKDAIPDEYTYNTIMNLNK